MYPANKSGHTLLFCSNYRFLNLDQGFFPNSTAALKMKFSLLALTFCLSCCGANAVRHGVANFRHFRTTGAASVAQDGEACATCCCNCCTKQAPAKPRKATTNPQEPGEMCYVLKAHLHIPRWTVSHDTAHRK
jgi:hypothetical protein